MSCEACARRRAKIAKLAHLAAERIKAMLERKERKAKPDANQD